MSTAENGGFSLLRINACYMQLLKNPTLQNTAKIELWNVIEAGKGVKVHNRENRHEVKEKSYP